MIEYTLQIAPASWGQKGVPHPQAIHACFFGSSWPNAVDLRWKRLSPRQAPDVRKARMYKVLKEVVEDNQKGTKNETSVPYLYIMLGYRVDRCCVFCFFSEKYIGNLRHPYQAEYVMLVLKGSWQSSFRDWSYRPFWIWPPEQSKWKRQKR